MSGPFSFQMPAMTSGPPDVENPTQGWGVAGEWRINLNKKGVAECGVPYVRPDHPDRCLYTVSTKGGAFDSQAYGNQDQGGEGWLKGMIKGQPRRPTHCRARDPPRIVGSEHSVSDQLDP
eukprot:gene4695-23564_t